MYLAFFIWNVQKNQNFSIYKYNKIDTGMHLVLQLS